jgi:threonine/homoserine/homoserine lactone efflux protein
VTEALVIGLVFGLAAGITPGPLLALVASSSLRGGARGGAVIAAAPLLTDAFLGIVAVALLAQLSSRALGVIGLLGALFVVRMVLEAYGDSRSTDLMADARRVRPAKRLVRRGAFAHALNPYTYIFWFAVGGPLVLVYHEQAGIDAAAAFVVSFTVLVLGSRLAVAVLVAVRKRAGGRLYRWLLLATAAALAAAAGVLAYESARRLW